MRACLIATAVLIATTSVCLAQANDLGESRSTKKFGGLEFQTKESKTKSSDTTQYQLDVNPKKDVFLYGQTMKMEPTYRQPGQAGLPGNATGEPETRYGIGLGFRF